MAHSRLNKITIGDIIIGAIMVLLCAAALYPVWYDETLLNIMYNV